MSHPPPQSGYAPPPPQVFSQPAAQPPQIYSRTPAGPGYSTASSTPQQQQQPQQQQMFRPPPAPGGAVSMSRPVAANIQSHYQVAGAGLQQSKKFVMPPKKPIKRNQVSEVVARLMYGFGDVQQPDSAAVDAMQDIVFEVIAEVTREAAKHRLQQYELAIANAGGSGAAAAARKEASKKLTAEDIEWALRKYPELLAAAQIHKKAR